MPACGPGGSWGLGSDPPSGVPGRDEDERLSLDNGILTPHMAGSPRSNGLSDIEELITALARAISD